MNTSDYILAFYQQRVPKEKKKGSRDKTNLTTSLSLYFSRDFVFPPLLLPVANMAVGKNKRLTKGGKKGAKKKM